MTETLNVNVLVAAKEEYTKQLISTIQPGLYDIIKQIFTDSQKNNIRRIVSYSNFQKELKAVPNWASFKLEGKLNTINTKFPYLMDLVTAIFISHVKILACVRLKKDNKSVKIKVPNLNTFLHKVLINCSENIYYNPEIIDDNKSRIFEIINLSITETIANQIPIEYILNEYLSGAFNEEEPFYPENDDIVEPDEEEPESSSDEEQEEKNIPIIPIQKPIAKKIEPGTLKDELPFNKPEQAEEEPKEIDDFNDLKDKKNEQFQINKQDEIEDDSDYSDDELSDEEPGDSKEQKPSQSNQPTLF